MNDTHENNYEFDHNSFILVFLSVITTFALIGNSIVIYILTKPEFLKQSLFRYLLVGTFINTIIQVLAWLFFYPDSIYMNENMLSCKLFFYIGNIFLSLTPYLNVLTSLDTCFAVRYPTKFQLRKKLKYQVIVVSFIFIILCLLHLPEIFLLNVYSNYGCGIIDPTPKFIINLYNLILEILIPFILMAITNSLTFNKLISLKKETNGNSFNNARKLFKVSSSMNLFFLLTNLPYWIYCLIFYISNYYFSPIIYTLLYFLTVFYFSCDILIYFIANILFRQYCL